MNHASLEVLLFLKPLRSVAVLLCWRQNLGGLSHPEIK